MRKDTTGLSIDARGEGHSVGDRLGTAKDLATKEGDQGPSKWALQRHSAQLLPMWSVKDCMHAPVDGVGTVTGIYVPATGSGVVAGVKRCRSVWVCPVCASQITEHRRKELREALEVWRNPEGFNGRVVMCTYTFRHSVGMSLDWMVEQLVGAFRLMKKGGAYGRLLKRYGIVGSVAARECKHSMENGYHPHIHELLFCPAGVDVAQLERELREMWETAAAKYGLSMNSHGFKLDDCDQHIAEYVAKFGDEPKWTEAEELSKWHVKQRGSCTRVPQEHYTPFQLLRFSYEGDQEAGRLFVEYAQAFYGRAQLRWSKGLRKLLGLLDELSDAEIIDAHEEIGQVMVVLDAAEEWPVITGNAAVGEFVQALATGNMQLVCAFLSDLGIERDPDQVPYLIEMRKPKDKRRSARVA
jgi:hypothetical protein